MSDPFIQPQRLKANYHEGAKPNQTNEANMPEKVALSLKINRICKTDAQEVNTKHVAKVACPIIHYTETNL